MPSPPRAASVRLPRSFYLQRTLALARALIGMRLVHLDGGVRRVGRIVETEAYQGPEDLAAHSARGRTPRTEVMFGPPGHAYVYLIYGMWNCLNVVAGAPGVPHAVLLRALEPLCNLDARTGGPGLLTRALGVDRRLNGVDLCGEVLWIEAPVAAVDPPRRPRIARGPRIGVGYAGEWAARTWRFYDRDSPWVSTLSAAARARLGAGRALSPRP